MAFSSIACMVNADPNSQGAFAPLNSGTLHFGEMSIDMVGRLVYRRGQLVNFSSEYFGLLARLVERRPELVETEELCAISHSTPATLTRQISTIRSKLGQTRSRPYIRRERKEGYRFVAEETPTAWSKSVAGRIDKLARPQLVHWGVNHGKPAGLLINDTNGEFVPWPKVKVEVEKSLLRLIEKRPFRGEPDFIVHILGPLGDDVGSVWFGNNPDRGWLWDGFVRIGKTLTDDKHIVWQTFQRYSDGSYRMLSAQDVGRESKKQKTADKT
jgi:DNA-binding winged helix-turn-helix (wHTH) protein